ncbi:WD repeat-containing protein 37 [Clonorchis sinensis]|uniref:WD repeat-containing protein 37 n=1 Tax=Clonorchis sinensis TaxID=79923 RepID=H2KPZ8_CLOSI|nr:WD repeat-containing protein 37 [Clonorchis sinensis]
MSATIHAPLPADTESPNDVTSLHMSTSGITQCSTMPNVASAAESAAELPTWHIPGEYAGPKDSVLPREFRQRLHKYFTRIEHEFEREYRRLYGENLALQERLEKFEDGDHSESTPFAKKLGASMLSQRIKQQYKQSTSRLVSSLRQSTGHSNVGGPPGNSLLPSGSAPGPLTSAGIPQPSVGAAAFTSSTTCAIPMTGSSSQASAVVTGSFAGHGGTWQLLNRINAHRDGIWEVTPYRKFVATASADTTVRLWTNDVQMSCLLVYLGHNGSINSVRFRNRDHLLLTSSGEGTAHLIRLPYDHLVKAAAAMASGSSTGVATALEAATSTLVTEVAGSTGMSMGPGAGAHPGSHHATDSDDGIFSSSAPHEIFEDGSPIRSAVAPNPVAPIYVRHPHAVFQSANLCSTGGQTAAGGGPAIDSSPLAAAEFLTGRDQIVTAGWDRLGRIYDLATGQEVNSLTGHDHQLTDVRCAHGGAPLVVTSSKDCTFRLWDFRQPGMRVHVQQAHTLTLSTTQFLPGGANERLISAGGDRLCRIWDLRQSRGPLVTIRTDSGINRLAISGSALNASILAGDSGSEASSATVTSVPTALPTSNEAALSAPSAFTGTTLATAANNQSSAVTHGSGYRRILALPLDNRMIKFFDLNGNRIGRLTRSSRGHTRMVTSVAWADEGFCNFFSTGFDSRLLSWQIHFNSL